MWWGVLSELAETKNNLSAFNAKSKGGSSLGTRPFAKRKGLVTSVYTSCQV